MTFTSLKRAVLSTLVAGVPLAAIPAAALPLAGPLQAPDSGIEQARMVSRTVVRGPRCKTVVVKRHGPGGMSVTRKRRCF